MGPIADKIQEVDARRPFKDWPNDAGFDATIEQREPIELAVKGFIPSLAAGILYRTGPGNHRIKDATSGDFSMSHWFDGFSHVYRFELIPTADGSCRVMYSSRRQVDGLIERVRKTGRLDEITFGQKRDPCESIFQKLKTTFRPILFPHGGITPPDQSTIAVTIAPNVPGLPSAKGSKALTEGKGPRVSNLVTLTDSSRIKTIDPETLEPLGVTDQRSLHPDLTGPISAAHAHFDPVNGDVYNFNLAFGMSATYRLFRTVRTTGQTEILATICSKDIKAAYIHSFFLTEDYVILAIWPSHFAAGGVKVLWEQNFVDAIEQFDASKETKWLVVDRKHRRGLVAKFSSPAVFSFHAVNAWQEGHDGKADIYCDVVQYKNLDIIHRLYYQNIISTGEGVIKYAAGANPMVIPNLARYRLAEIPSKEVEASLPKVTRKAEILLQLQGPAVGDLPTINPNYAMKKTRFVYSIVDRGHSSFLDGIVKTDLETKETSCWGSQNHTPGEAIFVRDPSGHTEDAGYLLSVILDGDKGSSYLICLDARTMTEVGRAECGVAVGLGFHGRHLPYEANRL